MHRVRCRTEKSLSRSESPRAYLDDYGITPVINNVGDDTTLLKTVVMSTLGGDWRSCSLILEILALFLVKSFPTTYQLLFSRFDAPQKNVPWKQRGSLDSDKVSVDMRFSRVHRVKECVADVTAKCVMSHSSVEVLQHREENRVVSTHVAQQPTLSVHSSCIMVVMHCIHIARLR